MSQQIDLCVLDEFQDFIPASSHHTATVRLIPLRFKNVSLNDTIVFRNVSDCDTITFVIRSFKDKATEAVFNDEMRKGFPTDLFKVARRKLMLLDAAEVLDDLKRPPGNRLEALRGDRAGQHSIRINDQFRVCFVWTLEGPKDVEIVDYH